MLSSENSLNGLVLHVNNVALLKFLANKGMDQKYTDDLHREG